MSACTRNMFITLLAALFLLTACDNDNTQQQNGGDSVSIQASAPVSTTETEQNSQDPVDECLDIDEINSTRTDSTVKLGAQAGFSCSLD